jgi:hypothetical protein
MTLDAELDLPTNRFDRIREEVGKHIVDAAMVCGATNPVYATLEVLVYDLSHAQSIHTRAGVFGLSLLGFTTLYSRGLRASRTAFKAQAEGARQTTHDALYSALFSLVTSPPIYMLTANVALTNTWKPALGAMTVGLALGPVMGASVNVGRDLGFDEPSQYIPHRISTASRTKKYVAMGALLATMLAANAAVYAFTSDNSPAVTHATK